MNEHEYRDKSDAEGRQFFALLMSLLLLLVSGIVFVINFWNTQLWLTVLGSADIIFVILSVWFYWWAEHKIVSR
jgi:hypothetical protein